MRRRTVEISDPTRKRFAVVVLALFCLSSSLMLLRSSVRLSRQQTTPDSISAIENRFRDIKPALPSGGIIGYLSDRQITDDLDWHDPRNSEAWRESRRVQYALSPILLDLRSDHQIAVGNFRDSVAAIEKLANSHFVILRDFGDGALLLNKAAK
jgi:hypothetical protein